MATSPVAADTGHFAQIDHKIVHRVLVNLLRLIHHLHEIRCIDVALQAHDGNRFAAPAEC